MRSSLPRPLADKIRVFVLSDYYLPGFKSGGPLRTISYMAAWMHDSCEFLIYTRDRDATDLRPYPGIRVNDWNEVGPAQVYYAGPADLGPLSIRRCLRSAGPCVVYLNSYFSNLTIWFLVLRLLRLIPGGPVVIAPRGELSPGALGLKRRKKRIFMLVARALGLYRGLRWQASADLEAQEIRAAVPYAHDLRVAPDLTPPPELQVQVGPTPPKQPRRMSLVFCSRVAEKKNPLAMIPVLARLGGQVTWTIYGPLRDPAYWQRCQAAIAALPPEVSVVYGGELLHEKVAPTLVQHQFFLLPTLSENFGHAIIEALAAGCPVIISDQTPWLDVQQAGAGWVVPVNDDKAWEFVLREALEMDEPGYRGMAERAREYGRRHFSAPPVEASLALFVGPF